MATEPGRYGGSDRIRWGSTMNRFDRLRQQSDETYKVIDSEIDKINILTDDAKRVSEIAGNAKIVINNIDSQFNKATHLTDFDVKVLFVAIAMQIIRAVIINSLNERMDDKTAAKKVKGNIQEKSDRHHQLYKPSLEEIISSPVPFDTIFGGKQFDLKLSGFNHRVKTLGHDPLLGLVFGTANIATSTVTLSEGFKSYHVLTGYNQLNRALDKISYNASTFKVFYYTKNALIDEGIDGKEKIICSLIKEIIHLASDVNSKASLPLPGISVVSVELAKELASWGLDFGNVIKWGEQSVFCELINSLIGYYHMLFYDSSLGISRNVYSIRTRKIITYSNIISSMSNVIAVIFGSIGGIITANKKIIVNSLNKLDIGGFLITLYRIINDKKIIYEIKKEFLEQQFYDVVMGDLNI